MEAILCNISALDLWRHRSELLGNPVCAWQSVPARKGPIHVDIPSASTISDIVMWGLADPDNVCVLVTSGRERRRLRNATCTVQTGSFPAGSFVRMSGQIYATNPELTFLQMAHELSFVRLLEVGYELCGTYRMVDGVPVYGMQPLTSVSRIRSYVNRAEGMRGRRRALSALQWVVDGSASPAETALSIVLGLPYRHGGYGLGGFVLNHELSLNASAKRLLGRESIRPDLYWPAAKYPVEFDGSLYHSSREQADYDERRRNAYAAMGMGVSVFRSRHLVSPDLMDEMVRTIRRNTKMWQQRVPADYEYRKAALQGEALRYWLDARDAYGSGSDFFMRAAMWAEPQQPW